MKNLTVITTQLIAMFAASLADSTLKCIQLPLFLWYVSLMLYVLDLYASFLVLILHVSFSALHFPFLLYPWEDVLSTTSLYFSDDFANGCRSVCLLPSHLGVSGHLRKSFIGSVHAILAAHEALLIIDCSWDRLLLDCSACKHFLLSSSFGVQVPKFPSWSGVILFFLSLVTLGTSENVLLCSRGLFLCCIVTSAISCFSSCSISFWKYSHKQKSDMKSTLSPDRISVIWPIFSTFSLPMMLENVD